MATIEERLQALEQEHEQEHEQLQSLKREHSELKKTIELQTIAIRALVSKEAFEKLQVSVEKLQERNDRTFDALIAHDRLTNERLGDIQNQIVEQNNKLDGKITGLQVEMRHRFNEQDSKITGLQTEVRQGFNEQDGKIIGLQTETRQSFNEQDSKITGLQTTQAEQTTLLRAILERLPEK